jgi:hypothetical protein
MSFLAQIKARIRPVEPEREPRIAVFGDSHTAALINAQLYPNRKEHYEHIRIARVLKEKNGKPVGDSTLEDFCESIRGYTERDLVFSAVGGNQYAVISTVQDPLEFNFLWSSKDPGPFPQNAELIPFRAVASHIDRGVRGTIGPVLKSIRESTKARVFHLAPPPPKEDNAFITKHFETRFEGEGMQNLGPTRPSLRLKCWNVQYQSLAKLCDEMGIGLVRPPKHGVTPKGFLAPRCYAKDVTHANRRYGEFVLKQMLDLAGSGGIDEVRTI